MSRNKTDRENEQEKDVVAENNEQVTPEVETDNINAKKEEDVLEKKEEEIRGLRDQIQRIAAEFDNYKKRTAKEKEKLYSASVADTAAAFLPVLDNIERALKAVEGNDNNTQTNEQGIREGVQLIYRQIQETLSNLKIEPIEAVGKQFNPEIHEAVMHVEDEEYGENVIMEEFQKGYIYKDEMVIRHSVVKVAN